MKKKLTSALLSLSLLGQYAAVSPTYAIKSTSKNQNIYTKTRDKSEKTKTTDNKLLTKENIAIASTVIGIPLAACLTWYFWPSGNNDKGNQTSNNEMETWRNIIVMVYRQQQKEIWMMNLLTPGFNAPYGEHLYPEAWNAMRNAFCKCNTDSLTNNDINILKQEFEKIGFNLKCLQAQLPQNKFRPFLTVYNNYTFSAAAKEMIGTHAITEAKNHHNIRRIWDRLDQTCIFSEDELKRNAQEIWEVQQWRTDIQALIKNLPENEKNEFLKCKWDETSSFGRQKEEYKSAFTSMKNALRKSPAGSYAAAQQLAESLKKLGFNSLDVNVFHKVWWLAVPEGDYENRRNEELQKIKDQMQQFKAENKSSDEFQIWALEQLRKCVTVLPVDAYILSSQLTAEYRTLLETK